MLKIPVCSSCNRELTNIEFSNSSYETFVCTNRDCSNKRVQVHRMKDNPQMRDEWRKWFGNSRP